MATVSNLYIPAVNLVNARTGNSYKCPLTGSLSGLTGDAQNLSGNVTNLTGDVTGLAGNLTSVHGILDTKLCGYISVGRKGELNYAGSPLLHDSLYGDFTGIYAFPTEEDVPFGDVSNLTGQIAGSDLDNVGTPKVSIAGDVSNLSGKIKSGLIIDNATLLRGNLSNIDGHISFTGDLSNLYGTAGVGLIGDVSGLAGDITGVTGDATGIRGNLDLCNITTEDREGGIDLADLTRS